MYLMPRVIHTKHMKTLSRIHTHPLNVSPVNVYKYAEINIEQGGIHILGNGCPIYSPQGNVLLEEGGIRKYMYVDFFLHSIAYICMMSIFLFPHQMLCRFWWL